jgi:3'-phosphoadenosine 5'-phosphosulfate (PAPS) 3'-phosphatase
MTPGAQRATQTAVYLEHELTVAAAAAKEAGTAVRDLYERAAAQRYTKHDGSPVTDADLTADRIIRRTLGDAFPDDAILTEEGADDPARLGAARCWVADPIDGTQQFVDRTGEFDILIALVEGDRPVLGVLYHPLSETLLVAASGRGAWIERAGQRRPLHFAPVPPNAVPRLATSFWFGAPDNLPMLQRTADRLGGGAPLASTLGVSVRGFVPPDHPADALVGIYVDGRTTMAWEWDLAAADVFASEAGGLVTDVWGRPHRYNKPDPRNVGGIVLSVDPATHRRVLAALRPDIGEPKDP